MKNQEPKQVVSSTADVSLNSEAEQNRSIFITDKNNQKHEGSILFSFEENGDEYVIYELNNQAFAAKVDNNNNLFPIEEDEWPLVEKIYEQFLKDQELNDSELNGI